MLFYVLQTIYELSYLVTKYLLVLSLDILYDYDEVDHSAIVSQLCLWAVVILLNTLVICSTVILECLFGHSHYFWSSFSTDCCIHWKLLTLLPFHT